MQWESGRRKSTEMLYSRICLKAKARWKSVELRRAIFRQNIFLIKWNIACESVFKNKLFFLQGYAKFDKCSEYHNFISLVD